MSDLLNILSDSNKDIDNQKLMDYLSGKLAGQEKHDFEKQMAENEMMNDAVEGLQQIKDHKKLETYVEQIQKDLNHYIHHKKSRRDRKLRWKSDQWIYISVLIVLMLIVAAYLVLSRLGHK